MVLSGKEIENQYRKGKIYISEFSEERLNPNSYNLRLHDELMIYDELYLDMKRELRTQTIQIPEGGYILQPGKLYLGRTEEFTQTDGFVPMLEGRSSVGRLGIFIHVTAGFGDVGFKGYWTLEISCIQPVRIYPFVDICQIYYHDIRGEYEPYTSGKYQGNDGIQASRMWMDFTKKKS